jgi:hypothetical protein
MPAPSNMPATISAITPIVIQRSVFFGDESASHVELAIAHRGPRWRGKLGKFWLYDQAIAFAGHGLDVDRLIAGISEGLAKLVHRGVDVGVVIDVRLVGPKPQTEFFPSKNVALLFDEREQHLVNLPLKAKARAAFGYFLALLVDLKRAEPDITRRELDRPGRSCGRIGFHCRTQVRRRHTPHP